MRPDLRLGGTYELLARAIHEENLDEQRHQGATAATKDIEAKKTPYLGPWDFLSEEVKEWDRQAVRGIPALLARAGYQIVSVQP